MASAKDSSKMTTSIDSFKLSSKTSLSSSKHASSESVLSKKEESMQMAECKKKLLGMEPHIIIRDENVLLRSPPQKKIVMPPNVNAEVRFPRLIIINESYEEPNRNKKIGVSFSLMI